MKHEGFVIEQDKADDTWRISVGEKCVAVGYPDKETAIAAVDERRRKRTRMGLEPAG